MKKYSCVATIAGSDPSGGAGIQADIKAISANGCYAAAIITALTSQNTHGVKGIYPIQPEFVAEQIDEVFSDLQVDAVKIGMLHNEKIIEVVADVLKKYQPRYVVLDPVMLSKNGSPLLKNDTINLLKQRLFPLVSLVTPNLLEAKALIEEEICTREQMQLSAKKIGSRYNVNVLVKGGHLLHHDCADVFYDYINDTYHWFIAERIDSHNTHGTGCTLSAAIAANLAKNYSLLDAIQCAKEYLTEAIRSGKEYKLGQGCGPVDHFHNLERL